MNFFSCWKFAAPRLDAQGRIELVGLNLSQIQALLVEDGQPAFSFQANLELDLSTWRLTSFDDMANLPKDLHQILTDKYDWSSQVISESKNHGIEQSNGYWRCLMASRWRWFYSNSVTRDIIVSSQVGCTLTCRFVIQGRSLWFGIWGRMKFAAGHVCQGCFGGGLRRARSRRETWPILWWWEWVSRFIIMRMWLKP